MPGADSSPRFSVVLVNYNGTGWTVRALDSLLKQRGVSYEVIIVDSGSSDGSPAEVEAWIARHPEVPARLLRFEQNIGFAVGCNRALERARGEVIFLLNNDAELTEGVFERVDEVLCARPEAGSIMCSMRFLDDPSTINSTGIFAFWDGSAIDRHWKLPVESNPHEVNAVLGPCGGAAAWRREVIDRVGFLNEEYFMYSEDVDMALRAQRAGFSSLYIPDAVVLHKGGAAAATRPQVELMEISYRNTMLTLQRNLPPLARIRGLAMFLARSLTGLVKIGAVDPVLRAKALAYWLRNRRRIAQERSAIRALGDDARVLRWLHLTRDFDR
jgi:hypothetical protein